MAFPPNLVTVPSIKTTSIPNKLLVVAPYFSQRIPVKCVEQYRWGYKEGTEFAKSDFVLHPKAREEKAELLKKGENNKIQKPTKITLMINGEPGK